LIQEYQCQIALFLSGWPETFCYTLTEALQNNLYPIALNYGAIAERIKALKFGKVLQVNIMAKDINKTILSTINEIGKAKPNIEYKGGHYPNILADYYYIKDN